MSTTPSLGNSAPGTEASPAPKRGWRSWDTTVRATVLGTVAGTLSLVVATVAYVWPRSAPEPDKTVPQAGGPASVVPVNSGARTTAGAGASAAPVSEVATAEWLNTFTAEAGGGNLTEVPRQVKGQPGYDSRPIAISCPSNENGDSQRDVTYMLAGRYSEFQATVRPYYPAGTDPRTVTYVRVLGGVRQPDGSLDTSEAALQPHATLKRSEAITAAVDKAEKLIIRVECQLPTGVVVITDARLVPVG